MVKDWQTKATAVDFYTVKGLVESIVAVLGLTEKSVIKRQRRFQKCIRAGQHGFI